MVPNDVFALSTDLTVSEIFALPTNERVLPVNSSFTLPTCDKVRNISAVVFNARSILPKMNYLKMYASNNNLDLIMITETWGRKAVNDAELALQGYRLFRRDREDRRGGGVAIYCSESLRPGPCGDVNLFGFDEVVGCTIPLRNGENLLVLCIYKAPNCTPDLCVSLNQLLKQVAWGSYSSVVVAGDFNYPSVDWSKMMGAGDHSTDDFIEAVMCGGLYQHVLSPTRGGNILDLIFSSDENLIEDVSIEAGLAMADHSSVCFKVQIETLGRNAKPERNFHRANWDLFRAKVNENIIAVPADLPVLEMWYKLVEGVQSAVRVHVPIRATSTKRRKPKWADKHCWIALKKQQNAHRAYIRHRTHESLLKYRNKSEEASREVRRAVYNYELKLATNAKYDSKSFWSYVNSKRKCKVEIGPIRGPDGILIRENKECAEVLNEFFASVFTNEHMPLPDFAPRVEERLESVTITKEVVKRKLDSLNVFSACGLDGISNRILRECSSELAPFLTSLFVKSLKCGEVPQDWKTAAVVPIHKGGSQQEPGNYRPVSLTPNPCKVMESIVRDELMVHLKRNGSLTNSQFGFLPGRSCELQLVEYVDLISQIIDQGDSADVIYLDFRKAFDTVPHGRLLKKLEGYGIGGMLLRWIQHWLTNRSQRVKVGDSTSTTSDVLSGVPQGSVLGPVLFLLYINDIDEWASCRVLKFADDTKLIRRIHKHSTLENNDRADFQKDVDSVCRWSEVWQMAFNVSKFSCLRFGKQGGESSYEANGKPIPNVCDQKDLGVMISSTMKSTEQCCLVAAKCHRIISWIRRTFVNWSEEIVLKLHKSLIRPHLEYAICAWCPYLKKDIDRLERVQRRITKMIPGLQDLSYENRLRQIGLQTLHTRRLRSDLILTFKIVKGFVDYPMDKLFQYVQTAGTRGHYLRIRSGSKTPRLDVRLHAFGERVVAPWNSLPVNVVEASSVETFKRLLHVSGIIPDL